MNTRQMGAGYQGAVEATLALVISVLVGVWADTKLDASPAFLFTGLAVGFGAFILRLTRLLREVNEPDDDKTGTTGTTGETGETGETGRTSEPGDTGRTGETGSDKTHSDQ